MKSLVKELKSKGFLTNKRIEKAFLEVDRADFVRDDHLNFAYQDKPLPIGEGQTISQPSVVAFMIENLSPKEGDKVLDIGSGSGWTTAILANLVGGSGKVIALEIIPELKRMGQKNVSKYSYLKKQVVSFFEADGRDGFPKKAPYDKILTSAALSSEEDPPEEWINQLVNGGIIVYPKGDSIYKLKKENGLNRKKYLGFKFVPLVSNENQRNN